MNDLPNNELFSAYLDGELTAAEQAKVERLLAGDSAARQLMDELRTLSTTIQDLPQYSLGEDLSESVLRMAERRILTDGDSAGSKATDDYPAPPPWRPSLRRLLTSRALAWSALAVAVAIIFMMNPPPGRRDGERGGNIDGLAMHNEDGSEKNKPGSVNSPTRGITAVDPTGVTPAGKLEGDTEGKGEGGPSSFADAGTMSKASGEGGLGSFGGTQTGQKRPVPAPTAREPLPNNDPIVPLQVATDLPAADPASPAPAIATPTVQPPGMPAAPAPSGPRAPGESSARKFASTAGVNGANPKAPGGALPEGVQSVGIGGGAGKGASGGGFGGGGMGGMGGLAVGDPPAEEQTPEKAQADVEESLVKQIVEGVPADLIGDLTLPAAGYVIVRLDVHPAAAERQTFAQALLKNKIALASDAAKGDSAPSPEDMEQGRRGGVQDAKQVRGSILPAVRRSGQRGELAAYYMEATPEQLAATISDFEREPTLQVVSVDMTPRRTPQFAAGQYGYFDDSLRQKWRDVPGQQTPVVGSDDDRTGNDPIGAPADRAVAHARDENGDGVANADRPGAAGEKAGAPHGWAETPSSRAWPLPLPGGQARQQEHEQKYESAQVVQENRKTAEAATQEETRDRLAVTGTVAGEPPAEEPGDIPDSRSSVARDSAPAGLESGLTQPTKPSSGPPISTTVPEKAEPLLEADPIETDGTARMAEPPEAPSTPVPPANNVAGNRLLHQALPGADQTGADQTGADQTGADQTGADREPAADAGGGSTASAASRSGSNLPADPAALRDETARERVPSQPKAVMAPESAEGPEPPTPEPVADPPPPPALTAPPAALPGPGQPSYGPQSPPEETESPPLMPPVTPPPVTRAPPARGDDTADEYNRTAEFEDKAQQPGGGPALPPSPVVEGETSPPGHARPDGPALPDRQYAPRGPSAARANTSRESSREGKVRVFFVLRFVPEPVVAETSVARPAREGTAETGPAQVGPAAEPPPVDAVAPPESR